MAKLIIIIILIVINTKNIYAENLNYQKIDAENNNSKIITIGYILSHYYYDLIGIKTHTFSNIPKFQFIFKNKYNIQLTFPFFIRIQQTDILNKIFNFAYGDPEINIGILRNSLNLLSYF